MREQGCWEGGHGSGPRHKGLFNAPNAKTLSGRQQPSAQVRRLSFGTGQILTFLHSALPVELRGEAGNCPLPLRGHGCQQGWWTQAMKALAQASMSPWASPFVSLGFSDPICQMGVLDLDWMTSASRSGGAPLSVTHGPAAFCLAS